MLQIKLFASLRDRLGTDALELPVDPSLSNTGDLRELLSQRGDEWHKAFASSQLLVAVNQEMATWETRIKSGDEIAFFPPVTGG